MNELNSVTELDDARYVEIDKVVDKRLVNTYIDVIEDMQIQMAEHNITAYEMYQYLLTLMINQC
jgi:hypothetical protein